MKFKLRSKKPVAPLRYDQMVDLADLAYKLAHCDATRAEFAELVKRVDPERAERSFRDVDVVTLLKSIDSKMTVLVQQKAGGLPQ